MPSFLLTGMSDFDTLTLLVRSLHDAALEAGRRRINCAFSKLIRQLCNVRSESV